MKTAIFIICLIPLMSEAGALRKISPTAHCMQKDVPRSRAELDQRIEEARAYRQKVKGEVAKYREAFLRSPGWKLSLLNNEQAEYALHNHLMKEDCSYRAYRRYYENAKETVLKGGHFNKHTMDNLMTFNSDMKSNWDMLLQVSYAQEKLAESELADLLTLSGSFEQDFLPFANSSDFVRSMGGVH